jgi:molecular chaperone DnaJ
MKDYFNILGVDRSASEDEIKKAYRGLAMKHHPDRGGDSSKFQEIEEAYRVLSDPNQRQQWEHQSRHPFNGGGQPGGGFHFNFGGGGMDMNDLFRNFHNGDPFDIFKQQQRRNRDLRIAIQLDLASTLEKQNKTISVQHLNGQRHELNVEIPRGARAGMQMKYSGHGDRSNPGIEPGDLYIEFQIQPHTEFQVDGIDLVKNVLLDCLDAITGTEVLINGLDGRQFSWNIPAGTQTGARFKISGQGLWHLEHPVRGNIIAVVTVVVPTGLTQEQKAAVEELKTKIKQ